MQGKQAAGCRRSVGRLSGGWYLGWELRHPRLPGGQNLFPGSLMGLMVEGQGVNAPGGSGTSSPVLRCEVDVSLPPDIG